MKWVNLLVAVLISAGLSTFLYFKKKKVLPTVLFLIILFCFSLFILKEKIVFSFYVKRNIPIFLLVDSSKSMEKIKIDIKEWKKFVDEIYYFSDRISREKKKLNPEFSKIYDTIREFREKKGEENKIILITDLQDNNSQNRVFDPYNVYVVYCEKEIKNDFFTYDLRLNENIISGEPFLIELIVFSKENISKIFEVSDDSSVIFSRKINLKKGVQNLKLELSLNLEGFKKLHFGFKNEDKIEKIVFFTKERYKIFLGGVPSVEFVFLNRFLNQFKWIKVGKNLLKNENEKVTTGIDSYNGYIFIDVSEEKFPNIKSFKALSNTIFVFTKNNKFLNFLTNGENFSLSNYFELKILSLKNNRKIIFGGESWKMKMKEAILDVKEKRYENLWFSLISSFIDKKESQTLLDKYNYIIGEDSSIDTSKPGLNKSFIQGKEIVYLVEKNRKENLSLPLTLEETNWMNIINFNEIKDTKKFIKDIKQGSKIIQTKKFELDFTKSKLFFIFLIILLLFFWFIKERRI